MESSMVTDKDKISGFVVELCGVRVSLVLNHLTVFEVLEIIWLLALVKVLIRPWTRYQMLRISPDFDGSNVNLLSWRSIAGFGTGPLVTVQQMIVSEDIRKISQEL